MSRRLRVQRYAAVGLFFASTLIAPALLDAFTTNTNKWRVLWAVLVVSAGATVVGVQLLESWQGQRARRALVSAGAPGRYPALVLTAGPSHFAAPTLRRPSLGALQLAQVRPRHLAVVGSPETEALAANIKETVDELLHSGLIADRPTVQIFTAANSNELTRSPTEQAVSWCLSQDEVETSNVILDVTGGTKVMSLGAFLVAGEQDIDCQVVRQDGTGSTTLLRQRRR